MFKGLIWKQKKYYMNTKVQHKEKNWMLKKIDLCGVSPPKKYVIFNKKMPFIHSKHLSNIYQNPNIIEFHNPEKEGSLIWAKNKLLPPKWGVGAGTWYSKDTTKDSAHNKILPRRIQCIYKRIWKWKLKKWHIPKEKKSTENREPFQVKI